MVNEGIVLGHKVSERGIEVDKAKVDAIEKMPCPKDIKGIRSFLGHAGFYRRFIKDFSKISRPLTNLLQKDIPFVSLGHGIFSIASTLALSRDLVPQDNAFINHKVTLFPIQDETSVFASLQNSIKVAQTIIKGGSINRKVIHEYLANLFTKIREYSHHASLKGSRCIT